MTPATRTLTGLVLGLALGAALAAAVPATAQPAAAILQPIGQLWLDALKMTTVPLVFALIVSGVAATAAAARAGGLAARALGWMVTLLILSAVVGALLLPALLAIAPPPTAAFGALPSNAPATPPGFAAWIGGLIPANPVKAAAEGNMLQIAVVAALLGFALIALDDERRGRLAGLFDALAEAMLVIVRWLILLAPIGVFALAFVVAARVGIGVAGTLLHYVVSIALVCAALVPVGYLVAITAGGVPLRRFAKAAAPAQAVAVSTQSSLAALPVMIEGARVLGVPDPAARLTLPLAVAAFRVTSPAANLAVILYCAAVFGVAIGPSQLAAGLMVAVLISFSTISLPSQITFLTALLPIAAAMGVPTAALPLLIAVETIPDIFRTLGNVTADLAVTAAAGRDRAGGTDAPPPPPTASSATPRG